MTPCHQPLILQFPGSRQEYLPKIKVLKTIARLLNLPLTYLTNTNNFMGLEIGLVWYGIIILLTCHALSTAQLSFVRDSMAQSQSSMGFICRLFNNRVYSYFQYVSDIGLERERGVFWQPQ